MDSTFLIWFRSGLWLGHSWTFTFLFLSHSTNFGCVLQVVVMLKRGTSVPVLAFLQRVAGFPQGLFCTLLYSFSLLSWLVPHSLKMRNIPRPLFLFHQTWQLALCIGTGSILLASTKPRFVRRTARWWSVIHYSREGFSTAPESNGWALHHSSRCLALRMVTWGLCAATRPWKPISWSSRRTVLVLTLLPEAVRNSVSVATKDRGFLRPMCFSTPPFCSVSLCGLPLSCCS